MKGVNKRLSLVVATYNRSQSLQRLLQSLLYQEYDRAAWECVVVNNNSQDDTLDAAERFATAHSDINMTIVTESQQGLSYARNLGICSSHGEVIVIVDDDEVLEPQFLASYAALFSSCDVAAAGGRIIPEYEEGRPRWMNTFCESAIASPINLGDAVRTFPGSTIPGGGNMAFRRTILAKYGLFDEKLGRTGNQLLGGEESNLFARLRGGGEKIWYCPTATTHHFIPPQRLERQYLDKLWRGVGRSQRTRANIEHPRSGTLRAVAAELLKWCATLAIASYLMITFRTSKAHYLFIMRSQITRGILFG
ncbi:MAG: glycosyltransferase [Rikenellaceae bacterium]